MDSFFRGMLQRKSPRGRSPGFLDEALNVQFPGGVVESRPGLRPFHGADFPTPCVGLAWHIREDGSRILLYAGKDGKIYSCIQFGDPQLLPLTYLPVADQTRTEVPDGGVVKFLALSAGLNHTYIFDGVNQNLKFDGTRLTKMGLTAPAKVSAEGAHTAGNISAGTRLYKQTFKSDSHESDLSEDARSIVAAANQKYTIPSPTATDPQVSKWALYSTISGGGTYYFVDEADIGVGIEVNVKDVVLQNQGQAEELVNTPPPAPAISLAEHRGQIAGVFADEPNLIRFSNINADYMVPEGWPEDYVQPVAPGDGDILTALCSLHEWLVAFKTNATYGVIGENFEDYKVLPVLASASSRQGIGCFNPGTILQIENALLFAARDGIYRISRFQGGAGLVADRLTGAIDDLYAAAKFSLGAATSFDRKRRVFHYWGHG